MAKPFLCFILNISLVSLFESKCLGHLGPSKIISEPSKLSFKHILNVIKLSSTWKPKSLSPDSK